MDKDAILEDYKAIRRAVVPLSNRLVESLGKQDIDAASAALGMRHGKRIELETEDEICVLMDFAIHNQFRNGRNAVARMLEENPPPEGSIERRILQSMLSAHFAILAVESAIPGFGVRALEEPAETPIVLVDVGFSRTAQPGARFASRIFSFSEGVWMTTGAALPVTPEAAESMEYQIAQYRRRTGGEPSEVERTQVVMRACVAAGASRQIGYATVGKDIEREVERLQMREPASTKVGRNDPCPCGSGKKYKKCCGG